MLKISRNTLNLWLQRKEETGDYQAITSFQKGSGHKITDWKSFEAFANQHGGKTQSEMASLWGNNVTQQNISNALKKLGLSRKKRLTATLNAMNWSVRSFKSNCSASCPISLSMLMKQVLIIERTIPTAIARLGNASMPSSRANAASESVGLRHWKREACLRQWPMQQFLQSRLVWDVVRAVSNAAVATGRCNKELTTPVSITLKRSMRSWRKQDVRFGICRLIHRTWTRLSIGGLSWRIGCDRDGMSLRAFAIVSMLLSKAVLTYLRRAISECFYSWHYDGITQGNNN